MSSYSHLVIISYFREALLVSLERSIYSSSRYWFIPDVHLLRVNAYYFKQSVNQNEENNNSMRKKYYITNEETHITLHGSLKQRLHALKNRLLWYKKLQTQFQQNADFVNKTSKLFGNLQIEVKDPPTQRTLTNSGSLSLRRKKNPTDLLNGINHTENRLQKVFAYLLMSGYWWTGLFLSRKKNSVKGWVYWKSKSKNHILIRFAWKYKGILFNHT